MLTRIWRWLLRVFVRPSPRQNKGQDDRPKDIYPLW